MASSFLKKYYKPWSAKWVIQRTVLVIREARLPQISLRNLIVDYKFSKEVWKTLKAREASRGSKLGGTDSDLYRFQPPAEFEYPQMVTCESLDAGQLSGLNKFFDHVYVVNLARRADKRLEMIQKLNRLNIRAEFFQAEDGQSEENLNEFNEYFHRPIDPENAHEMEVRLMRKVIYSPGAWATLKTYKRLLEDARRRGFRKILCLQDDAVFINGFEEKFKGAAGIIPAGWKMLYLGASQHAWEEGEDLASPYGLQENGEAVTYYHPLNTDGAFAIGLDAEVFDFLLQEINRMNCSFDSGPMRSATKLFRGECFVLKPNLVIADVSDSDIRISRKQKEFARTVRWDLQQYDYPFRKDLVSVIMPAYNAEKTIEKSIRSLLNQDYHDLEIIVADDCSTDSTAQIVSRLAREDNRIRLVRQEINTGCYGARNTGLRAANGKYFAFQDADDFSLPGRITGQVIPLSLGKALFTMSRIARTERRPDDFDIDNPESMMLLVAEDYELARKEGHSDKVFQKVGYITTVITRSLAEDLGLFWENRFGSDAEYVERIMYHKTGLLLPETVFMQRYLAEIGSIDGVFKRIDRIQMICLVSGGENLSVKFKQQARLEFQAKYRNRLAGHLKYEYPKLHERGK